MRLYDRVCEIVVEKSNREEDEEGHLLQPNLLMSYRWPERGGKNPPPNIRLQQDGFRRAYLALAWTESACLCALFPQRWMLDELRWLSFADQDFQQLQLGLNVLVFVVFHRQGRAIFLLYVSVERQHRYLSGKRQVIGSRYCNVYFVPLGKLLFTCRFAWRTGPRIHAGSSGFFSSLLELPGAAPPVPVCVSEKEMMFRSSFNTTPCYSKQCHNLSMDK